VLNGGPAPSTPTDAPLTEIETAVVRAIVSAIVKELRVREKTNAPACGEQDTARLAHRGAVDERVHHTTS